MFRWIGRCKWFIAGALCMASAASPADLQAREVTIHVKSLSDKTPVPNAIVDLQSCDLGTFVSDEKGKVVFEVGDLTACVLYISSSGYTSLVRSFRLPEGEREVELVFYMQRQDQFKTGQILSAGKQVPVRGAKIYRQGPEGDRSLVAVSDSLGQFGLVNFNSGQYHFILEHPFYTTQEKTVFVPRDAGYLGTYFMERKQTEDIDNSEGEVHLSGISSPKFSFSGATAFIDSESEEISEADTEYIIVLSSYRNPENIPSAPEDIDVELSVVGDWIRMYVGPFSTRRSASRALKKILKSYPAASIRQASTVP